MLNCLEAYSATWREALLNVPVADISIGYTTGEQIANGAIMRTRIREFDVATNGTARSFYGNNSEYIA